MGNGKGLQKGREVIFHCTGVGAVRGSFIRETVDHYEVELLQPVGYLYSDCNGMRFLYYQTGQAVRLDKPLIEGVEIPAKNDDHE